MARCLTVDGDYEICPRNPIVTHRHLSLEHEISVTGHADIVQTQKGEWWMVLLAVRPYQNAHFNLGRETFMIPVIWDSDGWLRVDNSNGLVNKEERLPDLPCYQTTPTFYSDNFESARLGFQWNSIHPYLSNLFSLTERPGSVSYTHLDVYKRQSIFLNPTWLSPSLAVATPCSFPFPISPLL